MVPKGKRNATMMNRKEIIRHLEAKEYEIFGDDLYLELQMFPQGYETVDEMVEDQTPFSMSTFLIEDFQDRYEI